MPDILNVAVIRNVPLPKVWHIRDGLVQPPTAVWHVNLI